MQNKDITFVGNEEVIFDCTALNTSHTQAATGATVKFKNVTLNFNNTTNYQGFAHTAKLVYENCTINGKQCLWSDTDFINCTLVNKSDYSVWTWGSTNVTFTDCTFESGGKSLLVYADTSQTITINVTLTDCVFNDDNTLDTVKAAVEVGSNPKSNDTVYNITMTNCEVNNFAINDEGINTSTTFYGNKNSLDADHLKVTIN